MHMHCVMQYFTGLKYLKKSTAHCRTKARRRRKFFLTPTLTATCFGVPGPNFLISHNTLQLHTYQSQLHNLCQKTHNFRPWYFNRMGSYQCIDCLCALSPSTRNSSTCDYKSTTDQMTNLIRDSILLNMNTGRLKSRRWT